MVMVGSLQQFVYLQRGIIIIMHIQQIIKNGNFPTVANQDDNDENDDGRVR